MATTMHAPVFDPATHLDAQGGPRPVVVDGVTDHRGAFVFSEQYCTCGGMLRQRDPAGIVAPRVAAFLARHVTPACQPASKAVCVEAREAARRDFVNANPQYGPYSPKTYDRLDVSDPRVIPWPEMPRPAGEDQEVTGDE